LIKNIGIVFATVLLGVIVMLLIIFLTGCKTQRTIPKASRFSGDHTTVQIRGMWFICYQSRTNGFPRVPPPIHTAHCDCLVDKSRENFSSSDYKTYDADNLTIFFRDKSIECELQSKVQPPVNPV